MPAVLLPASYGGISFWLVSLEGHAGRDIVVQSPARGDAHVLQDRGRRHRTSRCELLFVDEADKDSPEQRFRAFLDLASQPSTAIFTHPLEGSYHARVTDLDYSIRSEEGAIGVTCTFLAESDPSTVFSSGAGAAPTAGLEEVTTTAQRVETQLAEKGLASTVLADTVATVEAWTQADTVETQAAYLQAASLSQRISEETERLELVSNMDRWPLYREFVTLDYQMQRAAEAVSVEASAVFDVVVQGAMPLRALCARLYGAENAEDKARQVAQINAVRTPGLIPAGTTLKVPREGMRDRATP